MLVNLSNNKITYIDEEAFALERQINSEYILNIDWRNNLLSSTSFNESTFINIKRPVLLLFGKNNLTLDKKIFKPLLNEFGLTKMDLRNNPLACHCNAK